MNIRADHDPDEKAVQSFLAQSQLAYLMHIGECDDCRENFQKTLKMPQGHTRDMRFWRLGVAFAMTMLLDKAIPVRAKRESDGTITFEGKIVEEEDQKTR